MTIFARVCMISMVSKRKRGRVARGWLYSVREYATVLLCWQSGVTYLFCFAGAIVYRLVPLRFMQVLLSEVSAKIHRLDGHVAVAYDTYLYLDGCWSQITKNCTYIELFFITIPLVIRKGTIPRNLARASIYLIIVLAMNLFRLILTDRLVLAGVRLKISHDLIASLIYDGTFVIVFLFWLRATVLNSRKTRTPTAEEAWGHTYTFHIQRRV
jgi:exosortase/archaeosortase